MDANRLDYLAVTVVDSGAGLEDGVVTDIKALLREAADWLNCDSHHHSEVLAKRLEAAAEQFATADKVAEKHAGAMAGLAAVQTGETSRNGRDCKHGHLARACEICELEAKLAAAEDKLRSAYIDGWLDGVLGECEDFDESWPISDTKAAIDAARGEV